MKLFWRRWLIVLGLSVPVAVASFFLMWGFDNIIDSNSWYTLIFGLPITYYILIFSVSLWICKRNIRQAVIITITSPLSFVAHWMLIWG